MCCQTHIISQFPQTILLLSCTRHLVIFGPCGDYETLLIWTMKMEMGEVSQFPLQKMQQAKVGWSFTPTRTLKVNPSVKSGKWEADGMFVIDLEGSQQHHHEVWHWLSIYIRMKRWKTQHRFQLMLIAYMTREQSSTLKNLDKIIEECALVEVLVIKNSFTCLLNLINLLQVNRSINSS